ncbi:MAG: signal peptidase I [Clostridia bacterium]|nr:signal peptidase I [Clostridia bacterium]
MRILREILGWICTLIIAVAIAVIINLFIFQPHEVIGSSMEPTLESGNIGIMSKVQHTLKEVPSYNDIVVIDSRVEHKHTLKDDLIDSLKSNIISRKIFKQENHIYWIKRVIGKPGDVLEFRDGKVYRNNIELNETYIKEPMETSAYQKVFIPEKHVFVMGDNRNNSMDSRVIGSIPLENVIGKLVFSF